MRHYDDKNKQQSAPRHSAKGRRYSSAPETAPAESSAPVKTEAPKSASETKRARTECAATPTAPVPPTKAGYLPAVLFAGFIIAMAVWFIVSPKQSYSSAEKRVLAEFPKTNAETIFSGQFGKDFETYFADHFPARNLWVGVNAYTSLAEGINGASGVYNCKDGYLINRPISKTNELDKNLGILAEFKQTIGDVPMTAMFVPSTGYIAEDKLPAIHDPYNDDTYFNRTARKLRADGIDFVDLRTAFKDAYANRTQLYYRTDHHWTTEGAYNAYLVYCEKLDLTPAPRESFNIEKYDNFYGTTYSTSGFWLTPPDTVEVWNNTKNTEQDISVVISESNSTIRSNSMFFHSHDNEDDKYPIFLDGNHALTEITNENADGGTIVVIKDSFSHCFAPFLAENYSRVVLVDMRYYTQYVSEIVKSENPDQVLVLYGMDNFATDTDIVSLF